ncbi:peptide MFS transporter [Candidatus Cyanaurora vandensis]|uniref:peptide MFS transporter n=1 Tax=Candidatus Cyanaurora vandensis TaxID=2714958 RepID=UPI00257CF93B|nr:peptide MFS transporter [Candidatus Cyanaurora vandensis]
MQNPTLAPEPYIIEPTGFFGHPRGLATLFFTEFWERFSYYGMRALLILFMTASVQEGGLGYDTAKAGAIYGLYTAMVYLMALPGGWVADRLLGQRKAVFWGGCVIALGHFSLAIENEMTFYAGLVLIVLGTGLLKPNISVMVGALYPEGGAKRDAGFSVFYMGINLGAFVAPLACGYLGESVDWHLGFGLAGVGMVLGLVQYRWGEKYLGEAGLQPAPLASQESKQVYTILYGGLGVVALVLLLGFSGLLPIDVGTLANLGGVVIVGVALSYFGYILAAGGLTAAERNRVLVIAALFIFSALFWSAFEQAGSSLSLFANDLTNRYVGSFETPASWLQSVNPLLIIGLAPVFAWLWVALGRLQPSLPVKFALGLIFVGLGFAVIAFASILAVGGNKVSPLWLVLTFVFHTIGELCLSPVGLSAMTKLAPQRLVSQIMGVWFTSVSLGSLIAGRVGGLFESLPLPQLFGAVCAFTVVAGLLLLLLAKPIQSLMGEVK